VRVALYGRVSTAEQNAAMQIEELRAYCIRRQREIVEEFIDSGVSGNKESRPALKRPARIRDLRVDRGVRAGTHPREGALRSRSGEGAGSETREADCDRRYRQNHCATCLRVLLACYSSSNRTKPRGSSQSRRGGRAWQTKLSRAGIPRRCSFNGLGGRAIR
jgi:Resolvase, N terminal domain